MTEKSDTGKNDTAKNCLELKNISYKYNGNPVLENISFVVQKGDYLGVIGPNGGGKTTLIKIILGLLKPDTGHIHLFGKNINNFRDRWQIGYVPQKSSQTGLFFPATVEEIVKSGRIARIGLFKKFSTEDYAAVAKAMEITTITQYKNRLVSHLSGGERQKIFIARALAGEPKILILDEPTVAVDVAAQEKFYNFLSDLNKRLGLTIIFVTHDIDVITREAKTILCLNRNLVCHGCPGDFTIDEYLEKLYGKKVKHITHEHILSFRSS